MTTIQSSQANGAMRLEQFPSLLDQPAKLGVNLVWDLDGDVEHDLDSDDDEMKAEAERFSESGPSIEDFSNNLIELENQLKQASEALGLTTEWKVLGDNAAMDNIQVLASPELTMRNYMMLFSTPSGRGVNLNGNGDVIYVQLLTYCQLTGINLRMESGESWPIEHWKSISALNALALSCDRLANRKVSRVKENTVYKTSNGALVFIKPESLWSGACPTGLLINCHDLYMGYGNNISYTPTGEVADLESVAGLAQHPNISFSLYEEIYQVESDDRLIEFSMGDDLLDEFPATIAS